MPEADAKLPSAVKAALREEVRVLSEMDGLDLADPEIMSRAWLLTTWTRTFPASVRALSFRTSFS